jgi:hypothetical protein
MPKLQDLRKTKIISLPSYPDSKVEIYDSLLVSEMKNFDFGVINPIQNLLQTLPKFIKSWNFQDEQSQILPINSDNLGFLKQEDIKFLTDEITNFREENKKKQNT